MSETVTPMMAQYRRLRAEVSPDTILFFRLGDFYEIFFDEAKDVAQLLDLTLTKRQGMPMCGVPHHAAEGYIAKLIKAGRKVAICDQMEDPAQAKGIVRRDITRVITPGTLLEEHVLDAKLNNYLAGLWSDGAVFGMAFLDISTGAFWIEEAAAEHAMRENLSRYAPSEVIVPAEQVEYYRAWVREGMVLTGHEDWTFDQDTARDLLQRQFHVHSLDGFGCGACTAGLRAAGAVLHYVQRELKRPLDHVRQVRVKNPADFMLLDEATVRNLDLVESRAGAAFTVLGVLDATRTSMGSRLLRDWLVRPLTDRAGIARRLDVVESFVKGRRLLLDLRDALVEIRDLERLIARLNAGTGNARDVRALGRSLAGLPRVKELLAGLDTPLLRELADALQSQPALVELIDRAIVDEPPIPIREGGMIRAGYHAELDVLKAAATQGRQLAGRVPGARAGAHRHQVAEGPAQQCLRLLHRDHQVEPGRTPPDYVRKQTMVNAERFITPELKEYENKIFGAQERSMALEHDLFLEIRAQIVAHTAPIQTAAAAVAQLDVLAALAERAGALRYVRPGWSRATYCASATGDTR
jgi:DNA mismatch repair protein MutS